MIELPDLAAAGLAAGTLSAFVLGGGLLRSRRQRAEQRREIAELRSHLDVARQEAGRAGQAYAAEVAHLARKRVPAVAARTAHAHLPVPGPLRPEVVNGPLGEGLDAVLDGLVSAIAHERKRVDAAARAGMRGATREIQAGLYRLQDVLRGLQQHYDDPELAQTLYALDHENEQSLRRAQVTAVVCGAWVGLAREESHLVDAVTGGQSRLVGYHRVEINNHLEDGTALVSHAVEPVAIIVAELLDNALRHSSPDTRVVVNLERAHHGATVTVDDAGVGMAAAERAYAQRMVAGTDPILLSELGDPPRMGLAAIGQLTRQFDLFVDLSSPSPYGGVRAVLLIKNHLLSRIDPTERPQAPSAPRSTRGAGGAAEAAAQDHSGQFAVPHGLTAAPARPTGPGAPHVPAAPAAPHAPATPAAQGFPAPAAYPAAAPVAHPAPGRTPGLPPAEAITHDTAPDPAHRPQPDGDALPRRRRRVRPTDAGATAAARPRTPVRTPEEAAAALGALQAGTAAALSGAEHVDHAVPPVPVDRAEHRPFGDGATSADIERNNPR
ncbi:ATP-binding protein [Streptomyces sp. NPDC048057]|uniref:ATP-binding protein n=1 Tax=Streptomyces sp. NPDC048057 TaxID=3155628 RepID=UPI0033D633DF